MSFLRQIIKYYNLLYYAFDIYMYVAPIIIIIISTISMILNVLIGIIMITFVTGC